MSLVLIAVVWISAASVGLALLHAFFGNVWPPAPDRRRPARFIRTAVGNVLFVGVAAVSAFLVVTIPASSLPLAAVIAVPAGASATAYLLTV